MSALESYRPLDPKADWPFFDRDFYHTSIVREAIQPLTRESAELFWRIHFSQNAKERHPMLLPRNHWLHLTTNGPNWFAEYSNASNELSATNGDVATFLRESFALPERDSVFFVTMREHAYRMLWWVVMACWPCLVAKGDEGSILFHPNSGKFACFGPNGSLGFGINRSPTSHNYL